MYRTAGHLPKQREYIVKKKKGATERLSCVNTGHLFFTSVLDIVCKNIYDKDNGQAK